MDFDIIELNEEGQEKSLISNKPIINSKSRGFRIKELHKKGYSAFQIAKDCNMKFDSVMYFHRTLGLHPILLKGGIERRKTTEEDKQQIFNLNENGYHLAEISNKLNIIPATVRYVLMNYKKQIETKTEKTEKNLKENSKGLRERKLNKLTRKLNYGMRIIERLKEKSSYLMDKSDLVERELQNKIKETYEMQQTIEELNKQGI
jgi:hypothetical protein